MKEEKIVHGDTDNVREPVMARLRAIYDLSVPSGQLSTRELNAEMLAVTSELGREVAVYLNRQGTVLAVSLGDRSIPSARPSRQSAS